jgi:hypothetical protein
MELVIEGMLYVFGLLLFWLAIGVLVIRDSPFWAVMDILTHGIPTKGPDGPSDPLR